ncbi:MAG: hypothetical protein WCI72_02145 [archaeon]
MERGDENSGRLNSRGQVTIFIIIGLLIVIGIILIFIFQNELGISTRLSLNPTKVIETCAKENIEPIIESIISTGGVYYNGSNNNQFLITNSSKLAVLCKASVFGTSCTNTHPLISEEIRYDIKKALTSKLNSCFTKLKNSYPNAEIAGGNLEWDISIDQDQINVKLRKQVSISSGEESNSFDNFDFTLNSKMYTFVELANVIVNTESSCNCNGQSFASSTNSSGTILYMAANGTNNPFLVAKPNVNCDVNLAQMNKNYPNYVFTRVTVGNGEKIYTITSLAPPVQNFSFVVQNCIAGCGGPGQICYHHYHVGDVVHYSSTITGCHNSIHHFHDTENYIID